MTTKSEIKDRFVQKFGEPTTPDYLAECVIENIKLALPTIKIQGFFWEFISTAAIPNRNCSPVNGIDFVENQPDTLKYYPGFYGSLSIRVDKLLWLGDYPKKYCPINKATRNSLVHIENGTMSSGFRCELSPWTEIFAYCIKNNLTSPLVYTWEMCFFEDDFPHFKQWREEATTMGILKNELVRGVNHISHSYSWVDPATLEDDSRIVSLE